MIGALMFDDMVHFEPPLHHMTGGAFIGLVNEHLLTELLPTHGVVRATVMGMRGTVPPDDQRRTPRLGAVLHVLGAAADNDAA